MTPEEIMAAVERGQTVYWGNPGYTVIKNTANHQFYIVCLATGSSTPLLYKGKLAGKGCDFFATNPPKSAPTARDRLQEFLSNLDDDDPRLAQLEDFITNHLGDDSDAGPDDPFAGEGEMNDFSSSWLGN